MSWEKGYIDREYTATSYVSIPLEEIFPDSPELAGQTLEFRQDVPDIYRYYLFFDERVILFIKDMMKRLQQLLRR